MGLRPEDAVRDLRPMLGLLVRGAEVGAFYAREHFRQFELEYEPCAHATIFRLHARKYLKSQFMLQPLANNGICAVIAPYQVRYFKAGEELLPSFPISPGRHEYLRQYLPTLEPDVPLRTDVVQPMYWNLCLCWSIDGEMDLKDVRLAFTEGVVSDPDRIKVVWEYSLNDIVRDLEDEPASAHYDDDLDDEYTTQDHEIHRLEND